MDILQEIGLTKREAQVYETLLRLGESPISSVLKATGSHPQVVYRVLDSLVKKGLVLEIKRKNRKYVKAENPSRLEKLEEQRLEKLRKALPDLTALQAPTKEAIVRLAKGEEAVRALRIRGIEELSRGDTYYIIGASGDRFYDIMGDRYAEVERKRIRKKITKKLISVDTHRTLFQKDKFREYTEFRFLSEDFPVFSSTNIFKDTVAMIVWDTDPIVITIESKAIADSYRQYFASLWKTATP